MKNKAYKKHGFTFIEVLATIVLIALVLPVSMQGVSLAMALTSQSARQLEAMELAESMLAEVLLTEGWGSGTQGGNFSEPYDNYSWTMRTSDWTEAGMKQIEMTVSWLHRGVEKQLTLMTLVYEE